MLKIIVGIILFSSILTPVFAEVTELEMKKDFFTVDEKIVFSGIESEGKKLVNIIVKDPSGKSTLLGGFSDNTGIFESIPQPVKNAFHEVGTYQIHAFVYKIENATSIDVLFDGNRVVLKQETVLELNSIKDVTIEVEKTVVFTASVSDSSFSNVVFSLKNQPVGASIDSETGKFVWVVPKSFGSYDDVKYVFDVIATDGDKQDKETVTVTVKKAYDEPIIEEKEINLNQNEINNSEDIISNESDEPLKIPASFVDTTKDPQSYVDRYNNEENYKEWFDTNYPQYSSIYQAVGLDEPLKIPASFVDTTKDPQSYVDRYNNEENYKEWFDTNYPQYSSIYQAVGLDEPEAEIVIEKVFGECGTGTELIDGKCTIVKAEKKGGGCLIATATYGSEMASQVQQLREIRDSKLLNTQSGQQFMNSFNDFYYSFSPYIADYERENPIFKEIIKLGITPMISTLSLMNLADSESEVLGIGITVLILNGLIYFGTPIGAIFFIRKIR